MRASRADSRFMAALGHEESIAGDRSRERYLQTVRALASVRPRRAVVQASRECRIDVDRRNGRNPGSGQRGRQTAALVDRSKPVPARSVTSGWPTCPVFGVSAVRLSAPGIPFVRVIVAV
jgi:hypothetical protein